MKVDRTVFVLMYKIKGFRQKVVCVTVFTSYCIVIVLFVDQLLPVDVFSHLY